MGKKKSALIVQLLEPIKNLVQKYKIGKELAKEAHLNSTRFKLMLTGDLHDGLLRGIISLREFISKEELRKILYALVDNILNMSDEAYKEHNNCYKKSTTARTAKKKTSVSDIQSDDNNQSV